MKCYQVIMLAFATFALSACSDNKASKPEAEGAQLANPAAVYCNEHGSYDIASGQCKLDDNKVVDAWDFYREKHEKSSVGMPNPAAVYCEKMQGKYDLQTSQCTLPDGSVVNAWDYYRKQHQD